MVRILPSDPRHPSQMPTPSSLYSSLLLSLSSSCCCLCRNLIFFSAAVFVLIFVFVVVAIANVLTCRRLHGDGKAGEAGAAVACNAAGLLLASAIVVAAPAFALALWMPSVFCFEDGATGAGVFNGVGAGAGFDAIG